MPELSDKTKETTATMLGSKPQKMAQELGGGNSSFSPKSVKLLNKIHDLMQKQREDELKRREELQNQQESIQAEEDDRNQKLTEALKGEKPEEKPKKKEKKEKKEKPAKEGSILKSAAGAAVIVGGAADAKKEEAKVESEKKALVEPGAPKAEAPKAEEPKAEAPKAEAPKPTAEKVPEAPPVAPPPTATKAAEKEKPTAAPAGGGDKFAMDMIKRHEGFKLEPYKDTKGLWTIGVGHLIGDGKKLLPEFNRKFSVQEVDNLFAEDFKEHKEGAKKTPGFNQLNDKGQAGLIDLAFNMGINWYKSWPSFTKALSKGDTKTAAAELENSKWYKQVGTRAPEVVGLIKEGGTEDTGAVTKVQPSTQEVGTIWKSGSGEAITSGSGQVITGSQPIPDLSSVVNAQNGVDIKSINPEFSKRLAAMAADFKAKTGKKLLITSGYRNNEQQKKLWDAKLAENNGDVAKTRKQVAEPGPPFGNGKGSLHAVGLALDINSKGENGINALAGPRDKSTGWLESFGLMRPVPNEDWHVQLNGTPATPDNPDKPGDPVIVPNKDGKAADVSTGQSKTVPPVTTATPTESAPKSAAVAPASKTNESLKEDLNKDSSATVVNNMKTTSTTETRAPVKAEKVDDRPIYLRKSTA